MKEEHPYKTMVRLIDPVKVDEGVDRSSEGAVQPPSSLSDKFCCRLRDIGLCFTRLDICEGPFLVLLSDELEAQDTVFGQEHVLLENGHAVDTLVAQTGSKRVISMEILFERTALDCATRSKKRRKLRTQREEQQAYRYR